jgi:hypothetical protein
MRIKFDGIKKFLSSNKNKALIGAGLVPVIYLAWKSRATIWRGVKIISAKKGEEAQTEIKKLSESKKTDAVNTVRFMLSNYNTERYSIIYGRDKKKGYMGYFMRADHSPWLFFGWSVEFEGKYPLTPFWIELDEKATKTFGDKGLQKYYDIYAHPSLEKQLIVSIALEEMEDPQAVAGKVMELAQKTMG